MAGEEPPERRREIFDGKPPRFSFELPDATHAFRAGDRQKWTSPLLQTVEAAHSGGGSLKVVAAHIGGGEELKKTNTTISQYFIRAFTIVRLSQLR
jgi:hypothetical protein